MIPALPTAFGKARHRALECVRMQVRHTGHEPSHMAWHGRRCGARIDDTVSIDRDARVIDKASPAPGVFSFDDESGHDNSSRIGAG